MPERQRLGHAAVNVDVAVPVVPPLAGDGLLEQRVPDLGSGDRVDGQAVGVLEHHHGPARDLVVAAFVPQGTQLRRHVPVPPDEVASRWRDRGLQLRGEGAGDGPAGRRPIDGQVAGLRQQLLEAKDRARGDRPGEPAGRAQAAARGSRDGDAVPEVELQVRGEAGAEAGRGEEERVVVGLAPATAHVG